jgi:phospholipid/cholesterol/gamma-HCH transport system permease protein
MTEPATTTPETAETPPPKLSAREVVATTISGTLAPVTGFIRTLGEHLILLAQAAYWLVRPPYRPRLMVESAEYVGIGSMPIITLVGGFTGAVTALQAVNAFRLLKAEGYAGSAVGLSLAIELAPVLSGLMLAGRVGAGIATELGTMRITEQMDALESMAVSPVQYLVVPRLIGGTIMAPILTMVFFVIGMIGAYFVAVVGMNVDHGQFVENFKWFVDPVDIAQGLIKSVIFGLCITLIGCYQGYNASGGGRGVGLATTRAVVVGSVTILMLDFFLSDILLAILPKRAA